MNVTDIGNSKSGLYQPGLYLLDNARTWDQLTEMRRLDQAGLCAFCPEQVDLTRALYRNAQWTVLANPYPYANAKLHFVVVPDAHVTALHELDPQAWEEMRYAVSWAVREYQLDAYGIAVRNGDLRATGGTIAHLHLHLLAPNVLAAPVKFTLGTRLGDATIDGIKYS